MYHIVYIEDNPPLKMGNITRFLDKQITSHYGVIFAYKYFKDYFGSCAEYDAFDVYVSFVPVNLSNMYSIENIVKEEYGHIK